MRRKNHQRDRRRRAGFHVRRVCAQLKGIATSAAPIRVILNDLTAHGLETFSPLALASGLEVSITLEHPAQLYVKARVLYCERYNPASRVLSQAPFPFRIGVEFVFESIEEERAVREFYEKAVKGSLNQAA